MYIIINIEYLFSLFCDFFLELSHTPHATKELEKKLVPSKKRA